MNTDNTAMQFSFYRQNYYYYYIHLTASFSGQHG